MAYEIQEQDGKHCVVKQGTSTPVPGGCHADRADAVRHMRALYANVPDASMKYSVNVLGNELIQDTDDENTKWVKAWRYSTWDHPEYGTVEITPQLGQKFKENFDSGKFGREHLVNFEHGFDPAKGYEAGGVIKAIEPREDGIYYQVAFVPSTFKDIQEGKWRYLSPEYDDYLDRETGELVEDMPFDLALTNKPWFRGQAPLNFNEIYEEKPKEFKTLTAQERKNLSSSDFLYIEPDGTRHLPVPDLAHLRAAITRLSQPATGTVKGESWLTESLRASLLAKARKMLAAKGGSPKGGHDMDEVLRQFAERLGVTLTEDATNEEILAVADKLAETLKPLHEAREEGEAMRTFREAFPEQYKRMKKLEKLGVDGEAKEFAENYRRFTIKQGEREYKSVLGFSELVIDKITDTFKKFSDRSARPADLKELLDAISDKGVVDYSEAGSSRNVEEGEWNEDPKMAFHEAIRKVMDEDSIPYEAAMVLARDRYPQIYEEYVKAIPVR